MSLNTSTDDSSFEDVKAAADQTFKDITSIWDDVYGENDLKKHSRIDNLKGQIMNYFDELIQTEQDRKINLVNRVEQSLEKMKKLQEMLKIDTTEDFIYHCNAPLVEIDTKLLNAIDKYKIIEESRLEQLATLKTKEMALCQLLEKSVQKLTLENGVVPSEEEIVSYSNRVKKLEQEKVNLFDVFDAATSELANVMKDLEIEPCSLVERSILNKDDEFPVTKANFKILKRKLDQYQQTKANNIAEAEDLRKQLKKISSRIKQNPEDLENFLSERTGYTKAVIDELRSELKKSMEIQKKFLKEVITSLRVELTQLWDKCYVSKEERDKFHPLKTNDFVEDVLTLHEMELSRLQQKYDQYIQIYTLVENRNEMWDRLALLEKAEKDPNRLFNNRGGKLLLEEKERKTLEKDIIKLENKLKNNIKTYEEVEGKPFMYFNEDIREYIQNQWDKKQADKENEKLARKIANLKTIETESKLGAKPVLSAKKRKLGASQTQIARKLQKTNTNSQHTACSTLMVPRTPRAVSTPDLSAISSVASYNTFQENLMVPISTPVETPTRTAKTPSRTTARTPARTPLATRIPQFGNKF